MLPDDEKARLESAVAAAFTYAAEGRVTLGYLQIRSEMDRASALPRDILWRGELIARWQDVFDRYMERYGDEARRWITGEAALPD